jgi:hypothetical protein
MVSNTLTISPVGVKLWEVREDYRHDGASVIVPEGFVTDLASVPRILWAIFPPFGRYTEAAVVHDYLYRIEADRKEADKEFYYIMRDEGVKKWKAKLMYWAVRLFGGIYK